MTTVEMPSTATEDLEFINPPRAIPLTFDLGNLSAFDPNPVPSASLTDETALQVLARDTTQLLVNELLNQPRQRTDEGIYIQLPAPTTPLPREKPLPKPKPPTKWELFAKKKGIQKTKTPNTVYDEEAGEWVPRWGYKGINKKAEDEWLVELPNREDMQDEDPRAALRKDRKERIKANEGRKLRNQGEDVPREAKKKTAVKNVVTRKLAQRLRSSRVGKALGGKAGRRR